MHMAHINLEESHESPGGPLDHLHGQGTIDNPFRPAALDENIVEIAQMARDKGQPMYCNFEGSNFRINPDGTYEAAHAMPPLRDGIEDIFKTTLGQWRQTLDQPQQ